MKLLIPLILLVSLAGCAATPVDIFIPTSKGIVTEEVLGHLNPTKPANMMYHSLADTKAEKALLDIRKKEFAALIIAAGGETEIIDTAAAKLSEGAWWGITAAAGAAGLFTRKPGDASKITEALHAEPPGKKDSS